MQQSTLRPSVLTSSSVLPMVDLLHALAPFPDCQIDLFVFRETDLSDPGLVGVGTKDKNVLSLLNSPNIELRVVEWLKQSLKQSGRNLIVPLVGAVATYFPEITSWDDRNNQKIRNSAIDAIERCIRISLKLEEESLSDSAVVELVCGSRIDFCRCSTCSPQANDKTQGIGHIFKSVAKLEVLLDSLLEVEGRITSDKSLAGRPWSLALEFEPGDSYVLGDLAAIKSFVDLIKSQKYQRLQSRVGINIDIGHMRIAGIESQALTELEVERHVVHGHISDNPGMHTRDLPTGIWNPIDLDNGFDKDYLRWFNKIDADLPKRGSGLLFSRTVALELEGCDRLDWINSGVASLRFILSRI